MMITERFIEVLFAPIFSFLEELPVASIEIPDGVFTTLRGLFGACGYIFPMGSIVSCLTLLLGLQALKITMALIVRIKSFIPTMGA